MHPPRSAGSARPPCATPVGRLSGHSPSAEVPGLALGLTKARSGGHRQAHWSSVRRRGQGSVSDGGRPSWFRAWTVVFWGWGPARAVRRVCTSFCCLLLLQHYLGGSYYYYCPAPPGPRRRSRTRASRPLPSCVGYFRRHIDRHRGHGCERHSRCPVRSITVRRHLDQHGGHG